MKKNREALILELLTAENKVEISLLAERRKELTVITNSAFVASYIWGKCAF